MLGTGWYPAVVEPRKILSCVIVVNELIILRSAVVANVFLHLSSREAKHLSLARAEHKQTCLPVQVRVGSEILMFQS